MRDNIRKLTPAEITSDVFIVAPTQIDYIAQMFGDRVADEMNMRAFSAKIREIARNSLCTALGAARHMGEKK